MMVLSIIFSFNLEMKTKLRINLKLLLGLDSLQQVIMNQIVTTTIINFLAIITINLIKLEDIIAITPKTGHTDTLERV
jgi:hypothetical protein